MLVLTESEMDAFERVLRFWNNFGFRLESVICSVLRDIIAKVSLHCGMTEQSSVPFTPQQVPSFEKHQNHRSVQFMDDGVQRMACRSSYGRRSTTPLRSPHWQPSWTWESATRPHPPRLTGIDVREVILSSFCFISHRSGHAVELSSIDFGNRS